ncbi:MAG: hypothetical protein ACLPUT_05545 [Solirubrobacteraceae bacterium]
MRLLSLACALLGALAAIALAGCESTQEKSAKLEKVAKREAAEAARHKSPTQRSLSITKPSRIVTVETTAVLHSSEGTAAVVTLHNSSATALRDVPIEITVKNARGTTLYTNTTAGLAAALASVPLLGAHATSTWVDDQVQVSATPASVSAKVGEGERVAGATPRIAIVGARLAEGTAEGSVVNHSTVGQRELVVYAIARRAGKIVAAGRAVVPQAEAGATEQFQAFLIGSSQGAQLEVSALPSTLG